MEVASSERRVQLSASRAKKFLFQNFFFAPLFNISEIGACKICKVLRLHTFTMTWRKNPAVFMFGQRQTRHEHHRTLIFLITADELNLMTEEMLYELYARQEKRMNRDKRSTDV